MVDGIDYSMWEDLPGTSGEVVAKRRKMPGSGARLRTIATDGYDGKVIDKSGARPRIM